MTWSGQHGGRSTVAHWWTTPEAMRIGMAVIPSGRDGQTCRPSFYSPYFKHVKSINEWVEWQYQNNVWERMCFGFHDRLNNLNQLKRFSCNVCTAVLSSQFPCQNQFHPFALLQDQSGESTQSGNCLVSPDQKKWCCNARASWLELHSTRLVQHITFDLFPFGPNVSVLSSGPAWTSENEPKNNNKHGHV